VSWINRYVDLRLLIAFAIALVSWSLWEMAGFSLDVPASRVLWVGVAQGFGLGMFYVPLNVVTFATLAPRWRTEAAGIFNLMRNLGASVTVSVLVSLVTRYTQINHAELGGLVTPYAPMAEAGRLPEAWNAAGDVGRAALDFEVTRQAAAIAYSNDFALMAMLGLATIPLVLLFRVTRSRAPMPIPES